MQRSSLSLLALLTACTTITPLGGEDSTGTGGADGASTGILTPDTTGSADADGSTTTEASTTGSSSSSGEFDTLDFIEPTGTNCAELPPGLSAHCTPDCSPWDQDCTPGEACKPWANDGGEAWNANLCRPIPRRPDPIGAPCQVEGSNVSGIDTCGSGSVCWNVDPVTLEGECVAMCQGSQSNPVCDGADDTCLVANDGALILCLPSCDPLAPECDVGEGCYPGSGADFVCLREGDAVITELQHTACPAGSLALDEETCASFCDLSAKAPCEAGLTCTPYFEGETPKAYANVGVCL